MRASTHTLYGPDFVIVGVPQPDGTVMVIASNNLYEAVMEAVIPEAERLFASFDRFEPPKPVYVFHAQVATFVIAVGPDYMSALRTIMASWQPEAADTPTRAVGREPLALES